MLIFTILNLDSTLSTEEYAKQLPMALENFCAQFEENEHLESIVKFINKHTINASSRQNYKSKHSEYDEEFRGKLNQLTRKITPNLNIQNGGGDYSDDDELRVQMDERTPLINSNQKKPQLQKVYEANSSKILDPLTAFDTYVAEQLNTLNNTTSFRQLVTKLFDNKEQTKKTIIVALSAGIGGLSGYIFYGGGVQGAQLVCDELGEKGAAFCNVLSIAFPAAGATVNILLNFIFTLKPLLDVAIRSTAEQYLRNDIFAGKAEIAAHWGRNALTAIFSLGSVIPGAAINLVNPNASKPLVVLGALCGVPANVEGVGAIINTPRPPEQLKLVGSLQAALNNFYAAYEKDKAKTSKLISEFDSTLIRKKKEFCEKLPDHLEEFEKEKRLKQFTTRFVISFMLGLGDELNKIEKAPVDNNVHQARNFGNLRRRRTANSKIISDADLQDRLEQGFQTPDQMADQAEPRSKESIPRQIFRPLVWSISMLSSYGLIASGAEEVFKVLENSVAKYILGAITGTLTAVPVLGLSSSAANAVGEDLFSGQASLAGNIVSGNGGAKAMYYLSIAVGWLISLFSGGSSLLANANSFNSDSPIAGSIFTEPALKMLRPTFAALGTIGSPIVNGWATGLFIEEIVVFMGKVFGDDDLQKHINFGSMLQNIINVLKHTSVRNYRLLLDEYLGLDNSLDEFSINLKRQLIKLLSFQELREAKDSINVTKEEIKQYFAGNIAGILEVTGIELEVAKEFIIKKAPKTKLALDHANIKQLPSIIYDYLKGNRERLDALKKDRKEYWLYQLIEEKGTVPDIFADLLPQEYLPAVENNDNFAAHDTAAPSANNDANAGYGALAYQ